MDRLMTGVIGGFLVRVWNMIYVRFKFFGIRNEKQWQSKDRNYYNKLGIKTYGLFLIAFPKIILLKYDFCTWSMSLISINYLLFLKTLYELLSGLPSLIIECKHHFLNIGEF